MIDVIAWAVAAALAVVVGAFSAFELRWKAKRLRVDLHGLEQMLDELGGLQAQLIAAAARFSTVTGLGSSGERE